MGKKRKNKKKEWHVNRSKKIQIKWYGSKKRIRSYFRLNTEEKIQYNSRHQFLATTPECFSFIENADETIEYFNKIVYMIEQKNFRQEFYIDSSKVTYVSTEALIYMIAVIYNIKANRALQYSFTGNLPLNKTAKEVFEQSGYLNYSTFPANICKQCLYKLGL